MSVLCTGPESSGTKALARLVESFGLEAVHRSSPHGGQWWSLAEVPEADEITHVVVIWRDHHATCRSQVRAGHSRDMAHAEDKIRHTLASHLPSVLIEAATFEADVLHATYESLCANPRAVVALAERLGGYAGTESLTMLRDRNDQWFESDEK